MNVGAWYKFKQESGQSAFTVTVSQSISQGEKEKQLEMCSLYLQSARAGRAPLTSITNLHRFVFGAFFFFMMLVCLSMCASHNTVFITCSGFRIYTLSAV